MMAETFERKVFGGVRSHLRFAEAKRDCQLLFFWNILRLFPGFGQLKIADA